MSQVRFIADPHFGHEFMANFRGFQDIYYMNEHIIKEHNKIVNKKDITYILGDISMHKPEYYPLLDRMNGRKRIILGNHDLPQHIPELLKYCEQVGGMEKYKGIFLTHCPIHPTELDYRVSYNIHGHIHEKFIKTSIASLSKGYINDKRYINVCYEVQDYKPKTLAELIPDFEEFKAKERQIKLNRKKRNL